MSSAAAPQVALCIRCAHYKAPYVRGGAVPACLRFKERLRIARPLCGGRDYYDGKQALVDLRSGAMAKLTPEEREALGFAAELPK